MKTKIAFLTAVLLALCLACGCTQQPATTDGTTTTAAVSDSTAKNEGSETLSDADAEKLYTEYLTNGGYDEILAEYAEEDSEYEAEAVFADINDDGVKELLLHISDVSVSGAGGHSSVSVLLGVRDGKVEKLGFAFYGGGSGGGDYLFIRYDTKTGKHVLEYEEYVRDGMFFNTYALHFYDVSQRETAEKQYGLVGSGDVVYKTAHTLRCSSYYTQGVYAEDAQRVLGESDLCVEDDRHVTAYLYDDDYISEAEYDELCARYVEPNDPAYQMKPVTMDDPIPN